MKKIISIISIALVMAACSEKNPFLVEWETPYGIPPYEEIAVEDYIPAIQKGIEQQNAEIEAITSNPDAPTFENTIVPLELSGEILSKVSGVLYNVSETDRSDSLDAVMSQAIPLLSGHLGGANHLARRTAELLGATPKEACKPFFVESMQAALMPHLANMATVGIVSLPGMMTGQMISGGSPLTAIRYQVAIMVTMFVAMELSSFLSIKFSIRKAFDERGNLKTDL